jgi:hypothetical protein
MFGNVLLDCSVQKLEASDAYSFGCSAPCCTLELNRGVSYSNPIFTFVIYVNDLKHNILTQLTFALPLTSTSFAAFLRNEYLAAILPNLPW